MKNKPIERNALATIAVPQQKRSSFRLRQSKNHGMKTETCAPSSYDREILRNMTLPILECKQPSDNTKQFDLMQLNITVYHISGITCTKVDRPKKKKKRLLRTRKKNRNNEVVSNISEDSVEAFNGDGIPTTAVVSCRRQACSGTAMETFLPSLPLITTGLSGKVIRYKANWMCDDESQKKEINASQASTFKITRAMKKETYSGGRTQIGNVGNYHHETVDLTISIGRGIDMILLGSASLAVTGEEEGEVMLHLPVKAATSTNGNDGNSFPRKMKNRSKNNPVGTALPHNPKKLYSLDENATIRVGVRVLPCDMIDKVKDVSAKEQARKDGNNLESFLEESFDENLVIELDDENSLIEQLINKSNTSQEEEDGQETGCKIFSDELGTTPDAHSMGGFFCHPMQCIPNFHSQTLVFSPRNYVPYITSRLDSKKREAVVMPFSLMSSVSESTDGSEETGAFFDQQRTEI